MKEIAEIQKQEDLEEANVKDEEKDEVEQKRKKLESAQEKFKQTHSKIVALEGNVGLHVISQILNKTEPVQHKQMDEVSKKSVDKDKKLDSQPVPSLATNALQQAQNSTNSTGQAQSLVTVTVDST